MGASSWETRLRSGYGPDCRNPEVVVAITGRVIHNANGLHQVARRGGGCRGRTLESSSWAVSGYSELLSVCVLDYRENIPNPWCCCSGRSHACIAVVSGCERSLWLSVVESTLLYCLFHSCFFFYLQMWIFQLIPRLRLSSQDFDAIPDCNNLKTSRLLEEEHSMGTHWLDQRCFHLISIKWCCTNVE